MRAGEPAGKRATNLIGQRYQNIGLESSVVCLEKTKSLAPPVWRKKLEQQLKKREWCFLAFRQFSVSAHRGIQQWISELKPSGTGFAFWGTAFDHCGYCFDHDSGLVSSNCRKGSRLASLCRNRFTVTNLRASSPHFGPNPRSIHCRPPDS
jgi:hypothetical protein